MPESTAFCSPAVCASCQSPAACPKGCSQCLSAVYCDRVCQQAHWSLHRTFCVKRGKQARAIRAELKQQDAVLRLVTPWIDDVAKHLQTCKRTEPLRDVGLFVFSTMSALLRFLTTRSAGSQTLRQLDFISRQELQKRCSNANILAQPRSELTFTVAVVTCTSPRNNPNGSCRLWATTCFPLEELLKISE
jgi:hypothetical protein